MADKPLFTPDRGAIDQVKSKVTISDVAVLREANLSDDGRRCDCPSCGGLRTAAITKDDKGFRCTTCDASGDVIAFEMAAGGEGFPAALSSLQAVAARRDGATGDLFNEPGV